MSNSVHSVQAVHAQIQTEKTVQPPKAPAGEKASTPQDTVTISASAKQALAKQATGDVDHDGDSH